MARRPTLPYVMRPRSRIPPRPTIANDPDVRIARVSLRTLSPWAVRAIYRDKALDPRFRAVDRYLWRWSVGQGTGLPPDPEMADKLPVSRPTPLAPDEAILVDQAIIRSPAWASRFVFMWFRSDRTVEEIAVQLACRARAVYDERRLVLGYYLGRFTEIGITISSWEA